MKSIDYDKLEHLPHREKFWHKDGWKDWDYGYYRHNVKINQAYKIFYGSVGKNLSDIKKRVEPLLFGMYTWEYFLSNQVETMYYGKDGILYPTPDGRHNYWGNFYYGDENNCLQYVASTKNWKVVKIHKTTEEQKEIIRQRKINRKEHKREGLILINMINRPDLLVFYLKLKGVYRNYWSKKYELEQKIREGRPEKKKGNWGHWFYSYDVNRLRNQINTIDIKSINYQISNLEAGNFNIFYESNAYLYNRGKECPHFEGTKLD